MLSIEQKFRFEILEIPRAQWKSTFRLHRPDTSLCYDFFVKLSRWCFFIVVVPNAPPDNVRGNNETSTSIFVQWDEVPADNQNGIIVNYTVTHTKLPDGSPTDEVIVIAPKRNATLKRLKEFTNYSITVFASTAKGGGNRSEPIIVITDEDSEYNSRMFINSFFFVL